MQQARWFVSMDKNWSASAGSEELTRLDSILQMLLSVLVPWLRAVLTVYSRQRNWRWSPAFTCELWRNPSMTNDAVVSFFRERTVLGLPTTLRPIWRRLRLSPKDIGGHNLKANKGYLDVWWDSGVSHTAVCKHRQTLSSQLVYLEGSKPAQDLVHEFSHACFCWSLRGAPYKVIVSQGCTLDGQGTQR